MTNVDEEEKIQQTKKFFNKYSSRILYSEEELEQRQNRNILTVHQQYMSIISLKEEVQKLIYSKKEIRYNDLPSKAQ